jgi:NADPH2:quinone reductase
MKAIVCNEYGPPERLAYQDFEIRKTGPLDVRIAVEGAGVNFPDVLYIQNRYQATIQPPFIPGGEACGRIVEIGSDVKRWKLGDRIAGLCIQGAFAEEVVLPADHCMPVPPRMSAAEAAGLPLVYGTVMYALTQRGALAQGETLLVLGAAGGVGLAAVQVGKIMGARVIAAASSPDKIALCKAQGADEGIDYSKESLKDSVKRLTGGKGADVIFDPVGGELAQGCFSAINWNGRYLVIGFADGKIPEVALNRLLLKGASAVGVFWGAFVAREPAVQAANVQQLLDWYAEGQFKPFVSKAYPLAQAGRALRDLMDRKATGKVVLLT